MEPDDSIPNTSLLPDEENPASHSLNSLLGNPSAIAQFSEALNALRQHSFNLPVFDLAADTARILFRRTYAIINSADISTLHAARGSLHISDNYLAYISILHASLSVIDNHSPLVPHLIADYRSIVSKTSSQWAKVIPARWVGISRHVARIAIENHDQTLAISLIRPLREAVDKSAPAPDYLVPLQADFLAVCLEAKCYSQAAAWIREHRRLRVDVETTGIQGTDVHLFHHYSALIFTGLKDFHAGLQSSRLALSVPATSPGTFQDVVIATFRLHVLLHVLTLGTAPPPLKFSSHQTSRLRKAASEYMELAYAFDKRDRKEMKQILESNRASFEKHGNLGLVKQVMVALSHHLIIRLTKSFVTMKLEDVAVRAGLQNAEEARFIILEMIRQKKVNAKIDDRKRVVRLMDNDLANEEMIARNVSSGYMNDYVNIVQRVEAFREHMESDPVYLAKEQRANQSSSRRGNRSTTFFRSSKAGAGILD